MSESPPSGELPRVEVALRDGTVAELRPIRPGDRELLAEGFRRLSAESRFARFGSGIARLTASELDYLTDVDLVRHVAWGATVGGAPAGAGRFIRLGDGDRAEVAVAVVDTFQRNGLGRRLFDALVASAKELGVGRFVFSVHPQNRAVLGMIEGVDLTLEDGEDMVEGTIELADMGPVEHDAEYVATLQAYRSAPA